MASRTAESRSSRSVLRDFVYVRVGLVGHGLGRSIHARGHHDTHAGPPAHSTGCDWGALRQPGPRAAVGARCSGSVIYFSFRLGKKSEGALRADFSATGGADPHSCDQQPRARGRSRTTPSSPNANSSCS